MFGWDVSPVVEVEVEEFDIHGARISVGMGIGGSSVDSDW